MRGLFWLIMGMVLGALGYRYYRENNGRLPVVEKLSGGRAQDIAAQAKEAVRTAQRATERVVGDSAGTAARETVTAVAEEIAEAEQAKRREQVRGGQ